MHGVGTSGTAVRLRRTVWQRLRVVGVLEFFSWTLLLCGGVVVATEPDLSAEPIADLAVVFAVLVGAPLVVRVAVATEYVEADADGIRWRSLFRPVRVPWAQVDRIERGEQWLLPRPTGQDVLVVRTTAGRRRKLRPTVGHRAADVNDWLLAATQLSGGAVPIELTPPYRIVVGRFTRRTRRIG